MEKKTYETPVTTMVRVKAGNLLGTSENMPVDNTHTVTNDNSVFARGFSWEDEEAGLEDL